MSGRPPGAVERVAIVGAGTMGGGIAQAAAQAGFATRLVDADPAAPGRARAAAEARLRKAVELGKLAREAVEPALERIVPARDLETAVADAAIVIEAAPEELELKRDLFRRVTAAAPGTALLASNTSSISLARIAEAADPRRTLGLHFFNPVHVMQLVEIVAPDALEPAALERAREFVSALGKEAIVVRDVPGFATSRLGLALGLEAIRMVEQGVASAPDIDRAMELGYRHPMGPLRLTDLVGLDVRLSIAVNLHRELGAEGFRPPRLLERMVAAGALGQKAGRGFYVWRDGKAVEPAPMLAE
ncbi:MAG: 3-hydroxyacyl-CoA dehydrogenase family protein [Gemmatimonadota bacterium]